MHITTDKAPRKPVEVTAGRFMGETLYRPTRSEYQHIRYMRPSSGPTGLYIMFNLAVSSVCIQYHDDLKHFGPFVVADETVLSLNFPKA